MSLLLAVDNDNRLSLATTERLLQDLDEEYIQKMQTMISRASRFLSNEEKSYVEDSIKTLNETLSRFDSMSSERLRIRSMMGDMLVDIAVLCLAKIHIASAKRQAAN